MLSRNVSTTDRIIRVVAGAAILGLGWTGAVTGTAGTILKILGVVPLLTGMIGFCPLYALLGLRTNKA